LDLLTDTTMLSADQSLTFLHSLEQFLLRALDPAGQDTAAVDLVGTAPGKSV
jgi:hypothetical protein